MNASTAGHTARAGVVITGLAAVSAFGRGTEPLLAAALAGRPAFGPVTRFDVGARRVTVAATLPDDPGSPDLAEPASLTDELIGVVERSCDAAGLDTGQRREAGLLLAVHGDAALGRASTGDRAAHSAAGLAGTVAGRCGLGGPVRAYTSACVAASTAVADGAAMIARGRLDRVVVAAGYLVEPDQFALFDAGRALARDGQVRPFSTGRTGLLLGDGVAAAVLEPATRHTGPVRARLAGWARTGDGYHVVAPRPDGAGLARAIATALERAGVGPADLGYVNAHGSGTAASDTAEAAALALALGPHAARTPVSSTKSVHGQALEASSLIELIVTVLAMERGRLPVNAGYLGPDEACPLNLVLRADQPAPGRYALSLNAAFGGANTALLIEAPW
jgi:3-oxoacyl-(acyl-carrier-protein) synthase